MSNYITRKREHPLHLTSLEIPDIDTQDYDISSLIDFYWVFLQEY